jgi:hypothetical protein
VLKTVKERKKYVHAASALVSCSDGEDKGIFGRVVTPFAERDHPSVQIDRGLFAQDRWPSTFVPA